MSLREIADRLVEANRNGTVNELLNTDYAEDAVSIEAFAMDPSRGREVKGLEGIHGKQAWWNETMETHGGSVDGPYLHGDDRFAVIYEVDATNKVSQQRLALKEVAIYTVANGKIVREEFYYTM
ncbi:MAG: nuclear transport factor 2 family protein [Pseudomonadota bacterium]